MYLMMKPGHDSLTKQMVKGFEVQSNKTAKEGPSTNFQACTGRSGSPFWDVSEYLRDAVLSLNK